MCHDDDETNVWFDGDDDYEDAYDRYEDYVLETGKDPYGLFTEDEDSTRLQYLKNGLKRIVERFWHSFLMRVSADYRARMNEIPF